MKIKILTLTFLGALTVLAADNRVVTPSQGSNPAQDQNYNNPGQSRMAGMTNNMPYGAPGMTNRPDMMGGYTNRTDRPGNGYGRTNNFPRGLTNEPGVSTNWNRGNT